MRSSSRWVTQTTTSFLPKFLQVIINNSLDFLYWDFAFQNYFGRHYKMCRLYTSKNVVVALKFLFCKNLKKLEAWNPKLEFHLPVRTEHENAKPDELEAWKSQAWNISKVSRFFFYDFLRQVKFGKIQFNFQTRLDCNNVGISSKSNRKAQKKLSSPQSIDLSFFVSYLSKFGIN